MIFLGVDAINAQPYDLSVNVTGLSDTVIKMFDNPVVQYQDQYLKIKSGESVVEVTANGSTLITDGLVADDVYALEITNQPAMGLSAVSLMIPISPPALSLISLSA